LEYAVGYAWRDTNGKPLFLRNWMVLKTVFGAINLPAPKLFLQTLSKDRIVNCTATRPVTAVTFRYILSVGHFRWLSLTYSLNMILRCHGDRLWLRWAFLSSCLSVHRVFWNMHWDISGVILTVIFSFSSLCFAMTMLQNNFKVSVILV
jgi:hypothetical protein